jgi:hypothetical protein
VGKENRSYIRDKLHKQSIYRYIKNTVILANGFTNSRIGIPD